MAIEPFDWNVVVLGYWNPAILTPGGIAKRLFGLPEGTAVLVEVPIDTLEPHRVRHDGLIVSPRSDRLVVAAESPTLANLDKARKAALQATRGLPETPLLAAGFNIRYRIDDPSDRVVETATAPIDTFLSAADCRIVSKTVQRSMTFGKGALNLEVRHYMETMQTTIGYNYELKSSSSKAIELWLQTPIDRIAESVSSILQTVFELRFEEEQA